MNNKLCAIIVKYKTEGVKEIGYFETKFNYKGTDEDFHKELMQLFRLHYINIRRDFSAHNNLLWNTNYALTIIIN